MSHCPPGQFCRITVVLPDLPASFTLLRAVQIDGGWQSNPRRESGRIIYGFWCTQVSDQELVKLRALSGMLLTEGTDSLWRTKSGLPAANP